MDFILLTPVLGSEHAHAAYKGIEEHVKNEHRLRGEGYRTHLILIQGDQHKGVRHRYQREHEVLKRHGQNKPYKLRIEVFPVIIHGIS